MKLKNTVGWLAWCWVVALGLLAWCPRALAQSGPYGNEWITPTQTYYKVRLTQTGIYRLDYQYLTQAGLANIDPSRLQLWRRGREVAVYQGGTRNVFDANTYLEFYGQRNDGQLDRDLYKHPADQPHQLYSFYTDTAAYFLTYPGPTAPPAKRMQEPVAAGGAPHAWRLDSSLRLETAGVSEAQRGYTYLPWLEPGEGYFSLDVNSDTIMVSTRPGAVVAAGPAPRLQIEIVGATFAPHNVELRVMNALTGNYRLVTRWLFDNYDRAGGEFVLQRSEIGTDGRVTIKLSGSLSGTGTQADRFRRAFTRVITPHANRWLAGSRPYMAFANDSLLGGPATYELDSIPATVVGYDVHDPWNVQRVAPTAAQTLGPLARRFVFPSATAAQSRRLLLADAQRYLVPVPARRVVFRTINAAAVNFAIVSHPLLYRSALDGATPVPNAAQAYADYRASAAGGGYTTLLITAPELYDQFHYGERSWLALRHFGRWLAAANPTDPNRYLLLLGKGIVPSESLVGGYPTTANVARTLGERGLDLVPTNSRAASDNMITADFQADDFVPKLRTGRLNVTDPQKVMNYLGKLRTHEALGSESWRKNVLHLVGGTNPTEAAEYRMTMDRAKARVERPFFGGRVSTEMRVTTTTTSINIAQYLNAGVSLITYFGHGSNNTFALNFGVPTDPTNNYTNRGRYPFFFLNGCGANHTYTSGYTIMEEWLYADQKGALGCLGQFGYAYPDLLPPAIDTVYKVLFNDPQWYGKPIAAVQGEAVRRMQNTPYYSDDRGMEQLLATGWQGDPTLALFAPPRPDFVASAAALSVAPLPGQGPVRAASPAFVLNVGVSNPGKITFDPVEIKVTRTYASGLAQQVYPLFSRRQAWQADTTYALVLPNALAEAGTSTFRVELDPNNRVLESNEANNRAETDFTFLLGGLSTLLPHEFAIATTGAPRLVVQSNDRNGQARGYDFELDTVPTFTSPARLQSPVVTGGLVAQWTPALPAFAGRDSVVWYWRARFHAPAPGEDGNWATSSFRHVPGSPGGWSQSHYGQLQSTTRTTVSVSGPMGTWAFVPSPSPLVMRTRGGGPPRSPAQFASLTGAGIYLQAAGAPPSVTGCGTQSPNLLLAVYEPNGVRPVAMPASYARCGQAPHNFYYFSAGTPPQGQVLDTLDNLNYSPVRQQELANFLAAVPAGSYVAVLSVNRLRYSLLPASLKASLQSLLGSQLITQLADGEPLALLGQKLTATTGRLVQETGPNRALATPTINQVIEQRDTLQVRATAGRIVSPRIGPAAEWLSLYSTIRTLTPSGYHRLNVVAIDTLGRESVPFPAVTTAAQSLASLDAARYPYLRLELALGDSVTRVPPQLRQWLVTYRPVPEGVVRRDLVPAAAYAPATLVTQATTAPGAISFPVTFQNVSEVAFAAPLKTRVNVRNVSTRAVVASSLITTPGLLAPGASVTVPVTVDMRGRFGTFATEVFVNPQLQPEQTYTNNELLLDNFTIVDTNVPPTLDVAFDGRHILNGEIVSPRPLITILLTDEDRIRQLSDRSAFTVTLLRPGQTGPATLVNLNGPEVVFSTETTPRGSVAKLEYQPGQSAPLPDGVYTLRVQGHDPSNASAGGEAFEVRFEVVNAAQISHVYPYPNPVVDKTRFVFTLTGQEVPRNLKIQILTLAGRVVRELFLAELGPVHIGPNISDYAWDGTDQYGERLANGTYLYRVALDDAQARFGRRPTAGDQAFKNDWGKLVLLR